MYVFDMLSGIVEKNMPQLAAMCNSAKFFSFPYRAADVLPKEMSDDELQFLQDEFFLPFRTVAIEDAEGCVILQDTEKNQKGANTLRRYVNAQDPNIPGSPSLGVFPKGTLIFQTGVIEQFLSVIRADGRQGFDILVTVDWSAAANKDHIFMKGESDPSFYKAMQNDAATAASTAIQEIMFFNSPGRFIVEITPSSHEREEKKARKAKKITRVHQRKKYTILTPKEIRVLLKLPPADPTGRTQAPHQRRRVKRFLRSPRFTKKRFTWVQVDAVWIGPKEAQIGKHRYKVRLDI